jgi:hypothetical protein
MRTEDLTAEHVDCARTILRNTVAMWRSCGMKPGHAVKQTREQMLGLWPGERAHLWDFYFGRPS